jgi:hypothetical protein
MPATFQKILGGVIFYGILCPGFVVLNILGLKIVWYAVTTVWGWI